MIDRSIECDFSDHGIGARGRLEAWVACCRRCSAPLIGHWGFDG
jgi:hypothetical protein